MKNSNTELHDIQSLPKDIILYTTVLHEVRIKLKLNLNEYCIADSIYHLSANPKSKVTGWCYASKETLADNIGLTRDGILKILTKLIDKDLVERLDNKTGFLRTTEKWYDEVVMRRIRLKDIYLDKTKFINNKK